MEEITIARVMAAIEGNLAINVCLSSSSTCKNKTVCQIRPILQRAQDAMLAELNKETFADIATSMGKRGEA